MKEKVTVFTRSFVNKEGEPVVLVSTVTDGTNIGRGIAVCSWTDPPDGRKGAELAFRRAMRGMKNRGDERIKDKRAISRVLSTSCPFTMHVEHYPDLTFQEMKELFRKVY